MEWLNYHHLLYFWTVAREGGIAQASTKLRLAPPTISGQIHALEESLGEKLFQRAGRRLVLTEMGRLVFRYAEEIFSLGRELMNTVKGRPTGRPQRLRVGILDVLPKLVVRRLLAPVHTMPTPVQLVCHEDRGERLLGELSSHGLDVVLADTPLAQGSGVRAFNHLLGECGTTFFAPKALADKVRRGFPKSLDGQPILLPMPGSQVRRALDQWMAARELTPRIVAECEDSALLQVLGQDGLGIFPAPTVIADEVKRQYQVESCGATDEVRERFYAVSVERRLKHPAVVAISEAARGDLFQ